MKITKDELSVLADTVVRLTELKQRQCSHLCVENFSAECLYKLVHSYMEAMYWDNVGGDS